MNTNRIEESLNLELKELVKETRDIVKILYNKIDYNIRMGNDNEINRITKFILEYEKILEAYETMLKNSNESSSVDKFLRRSF